MPPLAQLRAAVAHVLDVLGNHVNPRANPAAIGLELRPTGAPGPDAAAEARQRGAGAHKPGQEIFQLRELDLHLAFPRPRPPGEDVEDQLRAIDDFAADLLDLPSRRVSSSKITTPASVSAHAASVAIFPFQKRRGVGLGSLLWPAARRWRRRLGEPTELIERSLRPSRWARPAISRPAPRAWSFYARLTHACTVPRKSSCAHQLQRRSGHVDDGRRLTAARGHHRADRSGRRARAPPRRGLMKAARRSGLRSSPSVDAGTPGTDRARGCAGTRTPTRPVPPVTPASATGALEERQRTRPERLGQTSTDRRQRTEVARDLLEVGRDERQSLPDERPFTEQCATASARNGSAARPYKVSVGSATTPPAAITSAAT